MKPLITQEDVYSLFEAPTAPAAFEAAISTGLLWMLATQPMDGDAVSNALNIPGKRGHYWLQYLESFGVLKATPQGYVPTELICTAILNSRSRESWQHTVLDQGEKDACVLGLPRFISESGSLWTAQGIAKPSDYVEQMRVEPQRAREFVHLLFEVHQPLAQQVADTLDLHGVERMMDVGGNSGVVSMALLRKYPQLTSTVVDIEIVCIAGLDLAQEHGFSDRLFYHPAEFAYEEFPTGFDLILQCDVSVYDMTLLKKLHHSLKRGGRLVFVEHFSPGENLAPLTRLDWTFLDSLHDPSFFIPTLNELKARLSNVGFEVGNDYQTLSRGWIVFVAQKPLTD